MATDQPRSVDDDVPDDPADLLPDNNVLTLDEYLDMHAAVGHCTRYEILYRLVHSREMSPKELEAALGIDNSTLHYHLNELVDVGLVQKRQRSESGQSGLSTYYRSTVFGDMTLTDGVDKLIRSEQAFEEMYSSSTSDTEYRN